MLGYVPKKQCTTNRFGAEMNVLAYLRLLLFTGGLRVRVRVESEQFDWYLT